MKRIIIHWTASSYTPNATDLEHYHFLIDGEGKVIKGKYKPEDNLNCNDGKYAAHCGGGNTGAIGIALCGMAGYKNPTYIGHFPLKQIQFERAFKLAAELCKTYNIPISAQTVFTHYEFGRQHPNTSSAGKIDINFIPYLPNLRAENVGGFIRGKVKYYYEKL